jgi:crotonobetainyl-CoA:carnitine CoA-transferase CaiB-like acyl-CoA transferase
LLATNTRPLLDEHNEEILAELGLDSDGNKKIDE